ncbi:hypothetical protein HYH03_011032 [Edaphochlamys debaryana]|uniref:Protein kinase domain-containing protein n=1 Tax=Edaphochlamys debaryana TaxID=47281 RepID=A0A835XYA1_9CHLO|nr:hypothetical protein HYH03_011032 [Edaphochlamys debaryana]|eukprot:KAG2490641.1 hypothetical protein HYH03_011032 [Edaphochlamys debaryana]
MVTGPRTYRLGQALEWLTQVASALAHMHGQKPPVVHRDCKAENVLLKREGNRMVAKLADLGLAVRLSDTRGAMLRCKTGGSSAAPSPAASSKSLLRGPSALLPDGDAGATGAAAGAGDEDEDNPRTPFRTLSAHFASSSRPVSRRASVADLSKRVGAGAYTSTGGLASRQVSVAGGRMSRLGMTDGGGAASSTGGGGGTGVDPALLQALQVKLSEETDGTEESAVQSQTPPSSSPGRLGLHAPRSFKGGNARLNPIGTGSPAASLPLSNSPGSLAVARMVTMALPGGASVVGVGYRDPLGSPASAFPLRAATDVSPASFRSGSYGRPPRPPSGLIPSGLPTRIGSQAQGTSPFAASPADAVLGPDPRSALMAALGAAPQPSGNEEPRGQGAAAETEAGRAPERASSPGSSPAGSPAGSPTTSPEVSPKMPKIVDSAGDQGGYVGGSAFAAPSVLGPKLQLATGSTDEAATVQAATSKEDKEEEPLEEGDCEVQSELSADSSASEQPLPPTLSAEVELRPEALQAVSAARPEAGLRRVRSLLDQLGVPELLPLKRHEMEWVYGLTGRAGSYMYMPPEVYRNLPYNEKSDVFSFGVLAYELMAKDLLVVSIFNTGRAAKMGVHDPMAYAEMVASGYRPARPRALPDDAWDLICECWHEDPVQRPHMADVERRLRAMAAALQKGAAGGGGAGGKPTADGAKAAAGKQKASGRVEIDAPACRCVIS